MFVVTYQDLRGWKPFNKYYPKPAPVEEMFVDEPAAQARKRQLHEEGLIACVTPHVVKHTLRNTKGPTPIDGEGPRFNAGWRMSR